MKNIDYKAEVKKVYPDAHINGDLDLDNGTDVWWIELKNGDPISDAFDYMQDAWEDAYHSLLTPNTDEKAG